MNNTIPELVKSSHDNAKNKGFYDITESVLKKTGDALDSNKEELFDDNEYRAVRDAFIAQRLMLITSELGEALEANRKNFNCSLGLKNAPVEDEAFIEWFKKNIKSTFQDELADVAIRLFDMCGWLNIDLQGHIDMKAKYNQTRERLHGKAY